MKSFDYPFMPILCSFISGMNLYNLRMVDTDVPVMTDICRKDNPLRSRDISLEYCSLLLSSVFLYDSGLPILMSFSLQVVMYCLLPDSILSRIVILSIWDISSSIVHIRLATGFTLPSVRVSRL